MLTQPTGGLILLCAGRAFRPSCEELTVKRTTATTERATRRSLLCVLPGLGVHGRLGMPLTGFADGHVRQPFSSNLYVSCGSAVV